MQRIMQRKSGCNRYGHSDRSFRNIFAFISSEWERAAGSVRAVRVEQVLWAEVSSLDLLGP